MIIIKEDKCDKLPGETSLFLSFNYNQAIINIIKSCNLRLWDNKTKTWELPITDLSYLIDNLKYLDDIKLELFKNNSSTTTITRQLTYKTQPYDYQLEGIDYGLNHKDWLLLFQMGLGKTLTILYLADELKARNEIEHCLIICGINSLKTNWRKEILKHTNDDCIIIGEKINSKGKVTTMSLNERAKQLSEPIKEFFVIMNVETLRNDKVIKSLLSKKNPNKFNMIAVDEAHKIKDQDAQQTKGLLKLDAKYKIAATGTLIMNNPLDCFVSLKWLGLTNSNLTNFKTYYCNLGGFNGKQIVGFKHMDILKEHIANHSLRKTKDILNLPDKNIIHEVLSMNDDHRIFYDNIVKGIVSEVDKVVINPTVALAMITRLRQASVCPHILTTENISSTKIDRAVELAEEIIYNGDKVVIFSNYKEPVREISNRLAQYNPLIGTGDISEAEFSDNIDKFQNDPSYKIFCGTISKMGTGITLTAASYAIFLDCDWTAAINEQCEDRIHRIGTTKPVFIYYLWNEGTSDIKIKELVETKAQVADWMIDNKLSSNMTSLLRDMLIE